MTSTITHCIRCDSEKIKKKTGTFSISVHQKTVKVPGVEYYVCSRCGETFLDLDNETKLDLYLRQHGLEMTTSGAS